MTGPHHHHHDHDHDHDHQHEGDAHAVIEEQDTFTEFNLVEQALRELLIEKGVFTAADIQRQIEDNEARTPAMGARVVAKAWSDPDFRAALLVNAKAAITATLGFDVSNTPELRVLENTPQVHHVVVCTLCSCYPRMILGLPPAWYKSNEYRARIVREPRAVLKEFGVEPAPEVAVRVVDSTADLRYLVIPMRPGGTEGYDEQALAALVGRDSMIGTGLARSPSMGQETAPV
jgi:nitrile hydratase